MTLKLIDSHLHLEDSSYEGDVGHVLQRAKDASVTGLITSPTHPSSWERGLAIAESQSNFVFLSLGFQPGEPFYTSPESLDRYLGFLVRHEDRIVALGEVGLDYRKARSREEIDGQKTVFRRFIELSDEHDKPLVVHCRDASKDTVGILSENGVRGAILHAFPGTVDEALELVRLGNYISIPTSVVYSHQKQTLAREVPLTALVVETDSPVMSPFRDVRRNEPAFLIKAVEKVAEIKNIGLEQVAERTYTNAVLAYNLPIHLEETKT